MDQGDLVQDYCTYEMEKAEKKNWTQSLIS